MKPGIEFHGFESPYIFAGGVETDRLYGYRHTVTRGSTGAPIPCGARRDLALESGLKPGCFALSLINGRLLQLWHRMECNRIVRNTCVFFDRSLAHNFQQSNTHNRSNMTTDNHTQRRKYRRNSAWSSFQSKCRNAGCTHAVIHTVIAKDYLLQQRHTGRRGSVLTYEEVFLGTTQQPSAPPAVMAKYTNVIGELLESLKQEQVTTVQRHATILH